MDHTPTVPVTVSIHRVVSPENVPEVTRWVQDGVNLANRWDGFLGSGWVRAAEGSSDWFMLYRFADEARLDAWERSEERGRWLARGAGIVEERRVERRTGIEGWFDDPVRADDAVPAPPRWKQATSIWLGFFPVNLLFTWLSSQFVPGWAGVPLVLRVLVSTLVLTPVMAYWVLPWVTRRLHGWLHAPR
ncbi:antibiotic biosynthesis monooxygenase [Myceligenerans salitolerans]|uniref:Antibiotic biosynthesis monooxygenase n=1 Tax=Myceligenerans salitolerans TaxID=1230528 RepID=A0ABS3IBA3_9MICO|nr:antibiotic biosynthesis monooxygenase [Myceligenerans salitolerans]MBO0609659.1 antibiotic biosynthesis monooxygenase [Myceligenerans salitolerans]